MIVFPLALIFLTAFTVVINPRLGIMLGFVVRPIIDCFWDIPLEGYPPTEIMGVVFPTVVLFRMIVFEKVSFTKVPLGYIWIAWMYLQLFNTCIIASSAEDGIVPGLNFLFRASHGFIGYFMLQTYFRERKSFQRLLIALLLAGIVPLSMSVYQNLLGGSSRTEDTVGNMVRNIGFYHDEFTLRLYTFQTLCAVILYWTIFIEDLQVCRRAVMLCLSLICTMTVYKLLSKAGFLIFGEFILTWNLLRKNYLTLFACVLLLVTVTAATGPKLFHKLDVVYSKEIALISGKGDLNHTLQGRWYSWKKTVKEWVNAPWYMKLVGDGSIRIAIHNDFLRVLLATGVIGFVAYIFLLAAMFTQIIKQILVGSNPLNIMALMLLIMWSIDAMGLVPGAYTGYQLYVWGLIGLALGAGRTLSGKEGVANV